MKTLFGGRSQLMRGNFHFTLRTLLLVSIPCFSLLAWFGNTFQRARRQHADVEQIRSFGALVEYDTRSRENGAQRWIQRWLGEDFFSSVFWVDYGFAFSTDSSRVTDADLEPLERLPRLARLSLCGLRITDAGMVHVSQLTELTNLDLRHTLITDDGLKYLRAIEKAPETGTW